MILNIFSVGIWVAILVPLVNVVYAESAVYKCKNELGALIYQEAPCKQNTQAISNWGTAEMRQLNGALVLKQRDNGHYFLEARINDKALILLVDTGASGIALPSAFARSAQISCRNRVVLQTANGSAGACSTIIPKVAFGPFMLTDVPAVIADKLNQPLLGMNVLQHFKVEQNNGEMRISTRD